MAFNDGEPIDAAKLTDLDTRINIAESKIARFGAKDSTVPPQLYAGVSGPQTIEPGVDKIFTIDYSAAELSSPPSSIILTPLHGAFTTHIDFYVISAGLSSAQCGAYITKSTTSTSKTTAFYYFVVTN
jgi:hypothetical protein